MGPRSSAGSLPPPPLAREPSPPPSPPPPTLRPRGASIMERPAPVPPPDDERKTPAPERVGEDANTARPPLNPVEDYDDFGDVPAPPVPAYGENETFDNGFGDAPEYGEPPGDDAPRVPAVIAGGPYDNPETVAVHQAADEDAADGFPDE